MYTLNDPQPPPQRASGSLKDAAHWLVCADLLERAALGQQQYGVPLTVDNGRNHLIDAYQEALDLLCYLRMAIEAQRQSPQAPESAAEVLRAQGYTVIESAQGDDVDWHAFVLRDLGYTVLPPGAGVPYTMERASLFLRDLGYTVLPKDRESMLATCRNILERGGPM